MRTLLLDSDIIAYQASAANEMRVDWDDGEGICQIEGDLDNLYSRLDEEVEELVDHLSADEVIVCLSCDSKDNFRKDFYPAYKENRKNVAKPLQLIAAKNYLAERHRSYTRERLEADDIMGILATHPKLVAGEKIIVSEDKDMQTIPGLLFNPRKDVVPRRISEKAADYYHLLQTLIGDPTDGYPGCPRVGPIRAAKIMADFFDVPTKWPEIVAAFAEREKDEEFALSQARCARILRATDYDFKNRRVIPWTPK